MNKIKYIILLIGFISYAQQDSTAFQKKVLDATEINFLYSYYKQDGIHGAVVGGNGSEKLTDSTPTIVISVPLNEDSKLTADLGISSYTSASSSNVNPFDGKSSTSSSTTGASGSKTTTTTTTPFIASPWNTSSGPSAQNTLAHGTLSYSHSSKNRNFVWRGNAGFSAQYGYSSVSFGGGISKLWNDKNTEVSVDFSAYLDQWQAIYPTELKAFKDNNGSITTGFFNSVTITGYNKYNPKNFIALTDTNRNSYSASFSFSQILTENLQVALLFDFVSQKGLLSTPYNRVYFKDIPDSFIQQFQLADDIERLPDTRTKFPIGLRLNYYLSEIFTLRTYYRYYSDSWGINSHTASIELPIKLGDVFTIYPMYRYYIQNVADYFAPYETHLSTEKYYTSDYDLSGFNSNQFGGGIRIAPTLGILKFSENGFYWKNIDLRYQHYNRSDGLKSDIISVEMKFSF